MTLVQRENDTDIILVQFQSGQDKSQQPCYPVYVYVGVIKNVSILIMR
jgi:hypothetical protein